MSGLDSIPVRVEGTTEGAFRTENLRPLLLQVEEALQHLVDNDESTTIDLGAMPFSAQDEADLRERLGRGEVTAEITAFGPTIVEETRYPGVWLVELKDTEGRRLTLHLEIAQVPAMLMAPVDDIRDGLAAMRDARSAPEAGDENA
ncbi:MAG: hydrogenase expression/formation protein [Gammaproteobacteria bacterium]|nr:hydrogenase expression/formation protein [Gammaproteobacteria bacterium]